MGNIILTKWKPVNHESKKENYQVLNSKNLHSNVTIQTRPNV